jgi:hypothetical protein
VIGFYRTTTETVLVRFDDGGCRQFVLGELELAKGNDQTLLREITERMQDTGDGFAVVMPVSLWADAHVWSAAERAAVTLY